MAFACAGQTGFAPDYPGIPVSCAASLTTVLFTAEAGQTYVLMLGTFDINVPPQQPVGITISSTPGKHCWYENQEYRTLLPRLFWSGCWAPPGTACGRPSPVRLLPLEPSSRVGLG